MNNFVNIFSAWFWVSLTWQRNPESYPAIAYLDGANVAATGFLFTIPSPKSFILFLASFEPSHRNRTKLLQRCEKPFF